MDTPDLAPAAMHGGSADDILVALRPVRFERGAAQHAPPDDAGRSRLLVRVLDQLDCGLMLVTEQGRLRFANRIALRECAPARCMRLNDGHVMPRHERSQQDFYRALAASRLGRRSLLSLHCGDAVTGIAVVPMDDTAAAGPPATLLVFGRQQVCEPLSVEFFAREHRLTAAEASVLRALCDGLRPAAIARRSGVAVSTVRTQVSSLRLKTGARSISELVRRVAVLPPILPVLD